MCTELFISYSLVYTNGGTVGDRLRSLLAIVELTCCISEVGVVEDHST